MLLTWDTYVNAFGNEVPSNDGSAWMTAAGIGGSATTYTVTGPTNGTTAPSR